MFKPKLLYHYLILPILICTELYIPPDSEVLTWWLGKLNIIERYIIDILVVQLAVLMLVKKACWWKTCMLVKNLHQHSPPKFHDVGENNVGEIVCWRKKICSFKIICMLVNYVGENFDVCWWKVFLMTKYVCWWKMLVKNLCWWNYFTEICMLVKTFTNMQL